MKAIVRKPLIVSKYAWSFPIWYFLSVGLSKSKCIFAFGPSSSPCNSFPSCLSIRISVMIYTVSYFTQKLFCFTCIRLYVCLRTYLRVEFFTLFCNVPFCLYSLILYCHLFNVLSFNSTFCFISLRCIVCSNCVALLFSSHLIRTFYFYHRIFAYCLIFLICVSSLISLSSFEFLFVFFRGTSIFSQTNFAPA